MGKVDPNEFSKRSRMPFPAKEREFETVGGGFIVIERVKRMGRLRPSVWPVEHATYQDAAESVLRLQKKNPNKPYAIFAQVAIAGAANE